MNKPPYLTTMTYSFSSVSHSPITLLLISLPCILSLVTTNKMIPSETETLFNIMETISSDQNWRISYPNPCKSSWFGIECKLGRDNHFHVTRLDFGTPPNPYCRKNATFPSKIFELPYLQSIFIFNCFTFTKTNISVFEVKNRALQQLSLRSNSALVGSIPPQLSSLKSLQILTLSQNRLTGPIPVEIFDLDSLLHLDLSYNMIKGIIPYEMGNLKNLVGLDLSYNFFTGSIPDTIGQMGNLQKLDLSSNSLMGTIPDTVEKLQSLNFLALSNNRFRGELPTGLSNLHSLQYFIMDDNPMSVKLPTEFGKLVKLQELRLANSGYFGPIPPSFSNLLNLSTLSLQNNRLTGEIPVSLSNLSHIYHMNLSRNLLYGVVPFNASFLNRLGRNLDLSGNSGLCLSPLLGPDSDVEIGVGVCGNNGSIVHHPLKKSAATSSFVFCNKSLFLLIVLELHYLLIYV